MKGKICWILALAFLIAIPLGLSAAELDPATKAKLEARLAEVEKEIQQQTALLKNKQGQTASIQRDISILTVQIKRARLNIEAKTLAIRRLGGDITKKQTTINVLTEKGREQAASLGELIREIRQLDELSLPEIVLSNASMNDFLADVDSLETLQEAVENSLTEVKETKDETQKQKGQLEERRDEEISARQEIEAEKRSIEQNEKEKQRLLSLSKQEENSYKKVIAEREAEKEAIREALFRLRDTKNISFGQALQYANTVSKGTGIRPAFLLAIITQESNLGQNVGTCNRPGDPPSKHWTAIMKPERDIEPFKKITKKLGINPEGQPLSCPIGGGWGGAMGPAQFIPSTWILYEAKIANVTGSNPPNPWDPQDAFAASGLYLSELGASARTYAAEHKAAAKYYAGSRWATAGKSYANSVMKIAEGYQRNIDILAK